MIADLILAMVLAQRVLAFAWEDKPAVCPAIIADMPR